MQLVQEIYIYTSYIGAVAGRGFNGFILSNGENLDKNQWPGRETPFGVLEGTRSLFPNSNLLETIHFWLVVSTHLKNISQIGSFPQIGVKIKDVETTS